MRGSVGVGAFVGLLEEHAGFVDAALGVVVGLDAEAVLVDGAVALAGDVEDAADLDVAPALGPGGIIVAAERIAERVDAGLVVTLGEEHFADAVAGERTLRIGRECLLVLGERAGQITLCDKLLSFEDGDAYLEIRR